jgi:hypothetical protein
MPGGATCSALFGLRGEIPQGSRSIRVQQYGRFRASTGEATLSTADCSRQHAILTEPTRPGDCHRAATSS